MITYFYEKELHFPKQKSGIVWHFAHLFFICLREDSWILFATIFILKFYFINHIASRKLLCTLTRECEKAKTILVLILKLFCPCGSLERLSEFPGVHKSHLETSDAQTWAGRPNHWEGLLNHGLLDSSLSFWFSQSRMGPENLYF